MTDQLALKPPSPALGRPRSAAAHQAMIDAARDIATKDGPSALNVQAICQTAGTSRATFYRRWSNAWECFTESIDSALMPAAFEDPTADIADLLVAATLNFYRYLSLPATKARVGLALLDPQGQQDMRLEAKKDIDARRARFLKRMGDDVASGRIVIAVEHDMVLNIITGLALNAAFIERPLAEADVRPVISRLIYRPA